MNDLVSAKGERAAIGGYLPQFSVFAQQAYQELANNNLEWIKVADPEAQKLDDIQYATPSEVHAYQVKWSIAGDIISYNDFKTLLPSLVKSWQGLQAKHSPHNKRVIGHLLTNKSLSSHDKIYLDKETLKCFKDFYNELWLRLKTKEPYNLKWKPILKELIKITGLSKIEFDTFISNFIFSPGYIPQEFNVSTAIQSKQHDDLGKLRSFILEKVADAKKPVEIKLNELIEALGWEIRFKTTFNHELFVDKKRYQPITSTLEKLNIKIDEHSGGYLFLMGGPGSGKSTLLNQWSESYPQRVIKYYAFDFSNPSSTQNYHERGNSISLYFDLVLQLNVIQNQNEAVLPYKDLNYLRSIFFKRLERLGVEFSQTGKKSIIIIDGLDHLPRDYKLYTQSFLRDLPLPDSVPNGVYIILGSQTYEFPEISEEIKTEWRNQDRTIIIDSLKRKDVFQYIDSSIVNHQATIDEKQLVFEKSQGHPLYLSYMIELLQSITNWAIVLDSFEPIDGHIEVYYKKLWQPIQENEGLSELLALLARINGNINLKFVEEWKFENQVLQSFSKKAKFLFSSSQTSLAFFHNSFRQFLFQQTAKNALTDEYDLDIEVKLQQHLANLYLTSLVEPRWNAYFHLYKGGNISKFLELATPNEFIKQLLEFRPVEEIKRDIKLGLDIATKLNSVSILARYLFSLSEIDKRERNVDPASFIEEFLSLNKPDIARNYIRNGKTLLGDESFTLRAARLFYDFGDQTEAAILFNLAEPNAIKENFIIINDEQRPEETKRVLKRWADVCLNFVSFAQVRDKINNVRFENVDSYRQPKELEKSFRVILLFRMANFAIESENLKLFDEIIKEFNLELSTEKEFFFWLLNDITEYYLSKNDLEKANYYFSKLTFNFSITSCSTSQKIDIAYLLYNISGNKIQTKKWIKGINQPINIEKYIDNFNDSIDNFIPFIKLNKLLYVTNDQDVKNKDLIKSVGEGEDNEILIEFLRMLLLITKTFIKGFKDDLKLRLHSAIYFYYKDLDLHDKHWYRLKCRQGAYFNFLINVVALLEQKELNKLGELFFVEFKLYPEYWETDSKRKILISLAKNGFDLNKIKEQLVELERTMLNNKDIDGRTTECSAHARAWITVDEPIRAEQWIKKSLQESTGVGYRKDYQISTWISWLQKFNLLQPEEAEKYILWFLSQLEYVKNTTEKSSFDSASKRLLKTTFLMNFGAGEKQMEWQLKNHYIVTESAIEVFILSYLSQKINELDFDYIFIFFRILILGVYRESKSTLLIEIFKRGFEIYGKIIYKKHLAKTIMSIDKIVSKEIKEEYFLAINNYVNSTGFKVKSYYPVFTKFPSAGQKLKKYSNNVLKLQSKHQSIPENDVLKKIGSYEDLLQMLGKEDILNSHFNWDKVITNLESTLTIDNIRYLTKLKTKEWHKSFYYCTLSRIALKLGDRELAIELAETAVQFSSDSGWIVGYDGGTRLNSFSTLLQITPNVARNNAFLTFVYDISNSSDPTMYIQHLNDILPVLTENYTIDLIWKEVIGYLDRLMANNNPIEDLPDISAIESANIKVLERFLIYLTNNSTYLIKYYAQQVLTILKN